MTGVGLVSPLGIGTDVNWEALCAGQNGIGPITRFDATLHSARIAGEVKNFDPLRFIEKKDVKKMDVFIQFAIAAAQFAVDDARLKVMDDQGLGGALLFPTFACGVEQGLKDDVPATMACRFM